MVSGRRLPSDADLRTALHDTQIAYLHQKMIVDRLRWNATNRAIDMDTLAMLTRDQLMSRAGY